MDVGILITLTNGDKESSNYLYWNILPVQTNIFQSQSNIFKTDLEWPKFDETVKVGSTALSTRFCSLIIHQFQVAIRSTDPDMTIIFHPKLDDFLKR